MTEQDKQALIKHFCSRDCGEAAKDCTIMPCHEIELIQEFQTTEPDSDTISRQAAIATAIKAAVDWHKLANPQYSIAYCIGEAMRQLPPANNSEIPNSSDTISRAKAIDGKICIRRSNGVEIYDDYVVPVEYLEQLPPAQPERIKGRWVEYIPEHGKCPFCGNQVDLLNGRANNFCSECGADMREVNHESN